MRLIFDAHLDIAWNAMSYDRDQLLSVDEMRAREANMTGPSRGNCTVSLPEMRRANIGLSLVTVLSRAMPAKMPDDYPSPGPGIGKRGHSEVILRESLDFANQTICCANGQGQLAYYQLLQQQGHLRMIRDAKALDVMFDAWPGSPTNSAPIGVILSMEGCDPIIDPAGAQWWWQQGLRTACLAHYGPSAYAMGTGGDGPLTASGRDLVRQFDQLGVILDLVHTADTALDEALDLYQRPVFVSHGNCRALVPGDRQFSDEQIKRIAERGGVIGVVVDCWMLIPDYRGDGPTKTVHLDAVADHIDHICQLTSDTGHVGIGSDLDGGFGNEETPAELRTIADLQKLDAILSSRGYSDADIDGIFHGNWLRFFRQTLPGG